MSLAAGSRSYLLNGLWLLHLPPFPFSNHKAVVVRIAPNQTMELVNYKTFLWTVSGQGGEIIWKWPWLSWPCSHDFRTLLPQRMRTLTSYNCPGDLVQWYMTSIFQRLHQIQCQDAFNKQQLGLQKLAHCQFPPCFRTFSVVVWA